jgi:PAS domain S-box-containing protein
MIAKRLRWNWFSTRLGVNTAILLFNAVLIGILWYVVFGLVRAEHENAIRTAIDRNDNLAIAFEQYTIRTIESADAAIKHLVREYARHSGKLDPAIFFEDFTFDNTAFTRLILANESGEAVTVSSTGKPLRWVSVEGLEYFQAHIGRDSGELFIGKPAVDRITGKTVIPVTRRINKVDGKFGGIAMALIEPGKFIQILRDAKLGTEDVISLAGLDGYIRARLKGTTTSWGEDIRESPLFAELKKTPVGHYYARGQLDGTPRFFSYRMNPQYQVVTTVGLAEANVLAEFYRRQSLYFLGAGVISAAIVFFAALLILTLEIQRRAAADASQNQARFTAVFEQAAVGMALLDAEGKYVNLNQKLCDLIGYSRTELLGLGSIDITHPDDVAEDKITRARIQTEPDAFKYVEREKRYLNKYGAVVWCAVTVSPVYDAAGTIEYVLVVIQSISDRRRAEKERRAIEEKLRISEANLISAQAIAKVGSWETDLATMAVNWSAETHRIFETNPATFLPSHQKFLERVHPDDRNTVDQAFIGSFADESPHEVEHRVLLPDGRIKFVAERWRVFMDASEKPVRAMGTCQDITAQKQIEHDLRDYGLRLQQLSRQLMSVEERERRRLGRELHDRTGSNLSALLLSFEVLHSKLPPDLAEKLGPRMSACEHLLRETIRQMRGVLADLRPPALEELGLLAALRHYTGVLIQSGAIEIVVEGREPSPRLPASVEIALFRITQEALNNAIRHAQAKRITIGLLASATEVTLTVTDDGSGFDSAARPAGSASLGLVSMRERSEAINARFYVETAPGNGTNIVVVVPYPNAPEQPA